MFQNRKLKEMVLKFGVYPFQYISHQPRHGFKLLSQSIKIYIDQCENVPIGFLQNGFRYFHYLHFITSQGRSELLDEPQFDWVKNILETCQNKSFDGRLNFRMDSCGEWVGTIN
jgi:hypothetical protein